MVTNVDPTHTITLRNAFIADATRRFVALKRVITQSIVNEDIFQLGQPPMRERIAGLAALTPANPNTFASLTPAERIGAFDIWLAEQEAAGVLEVVSGARGTSQAWSNQYIRSSYQRGLQKSLRDLKAKGIDVPAAVLPGAGGVGGVFLTPFHQSRIEVLYAETFMGLENITLTMNTQIRRVIAEGMAEGIGPGEMARRINNRVDKIGMTRARLIARTEVVKTYNTAQVYEFQRIENIIGEEIFMQWWTAEDERVRSSHRARHSKIYTKDDYLSLIGEPNCRCTGLPYVMSIDGQAELTSAADTRSSEAGIIKEDKRQTRARQVINSEVNTLDDKIYSSDSISMSGRELRQNYTDGGNVAYPADQRSDVRRRLRQEGKLYKEYATDLRNNIAMQVDDIYGKGKGAAYTQLDDFFINEWTNSSSSEGASILKKRLYDRGLTAKPTFDTALLSTNREFDAFLDRSQTLTEAFTQANGLTVDDIDMWIDTSMAASSSVSSQGLTVYRGQNDLLFEQLGVARPIAGEVSSFDVTFNSISSATTVKEIGRDFGTTVFKYEVSAENVLANPLTSPNFDTREWEAIIINPPDTTFRATAVTSRDVDSLNILRLSPLAHMLSVRKRKLPTLELIIGADNKNENWIKGIGNN